MTPEKSTPKVSVIIPCFNREQYLGMAIQSVLVQTFTDFELIIVDNNSTDGSLEIAQIAAQQDSRVRVLTEEAQGAAYALKAGFAEAKGKYIGQVDSDDRLEARALELTVKVLDENAECGLVYTNYMEIDKNGRVLRPGKQCAIPYSKERILIDFMTFHFRLIRRSVYLLSGGFNAQFNSIEDYELCLRLSEITKVQKVEKLLYQYRIHPESSTRTGGLKMIHLCKEAIEETLKRRNLDKQYRVKFEFNPTFWLEEIKSKK